MSIQLSFSHCAIFRHKRTSFHDDVNGEFPAERTVTRGVDVFFDLRLNKQLSKQPWCWWFETSSCSLWRHCNVWTEKKTWTHCIAVVSIITNYFIIIHDRWTWSLISASLWSTGNSENTISYDNTLEFSQNFRLGLSFLTHLPLDKMAVFSQTIFSYVFSWMKTFAFWLKFLRHLFLGSNWQ